MIQWNTQLSVGIREIDDQHQRLINLIVELNDAMRTGQGKEILKKTLRDMASYAVMHFSTEEKYFDRYQYPDSEAHKKAHQAFVQKVSAFKADYEAGRIGLTIPVMTFLSDWLKDHIMGSDQKYAPFLLEKGVK